MLDIKKGKFCNVLFCCKFNETMVYKMKIFIKIKKGFSQSKERFSGRISMYQKIYII